MKLRIALPALLVLGLVVGHAWSGSVKDTPHNLSVSGPGSIKAVSEDEICIFCHAPHSTRPQAPLWNREDPGGPYTLYTSSTLKVAPGQPSGASRLCLSCHDGTIAPGKVLSRAVTIPIAGGPTIPVGRSRVGQDLSDDHPVSLSYSASRAALGDELRAAPSLNGKSLLDSQQRVQCTSCHDPHDNDYGHFLRTDPQHGALCLACHRPTGWSGSAHAISTRTWNGTGADPWPESDSTTVAANACRNCHTPHEAAGPARLLKSGTEEGVCLVCHSGNAAGLNIAAELNKWSAHRVALSSGIHDPGEAPDGRRTHVECVDCHDPHQARPHSSPFSGMPGPLVGVAGLMPSGAPSYPATRDYEICYRCHADPTDSNPSRIPRMTTQADIRRLFDPQNPSFHPVESSGVNPDVPSLMAPYTTSSTITCTDCHENDNGPGTGGSGPRGPHGSRWSFLLERRYDTASPNPESAQAYALCYKCHSRSSILADESFAEHKEHLEHDVSCSACHAPHGVDAAQQGAAAGTHLINFDSRAVSPNRDGVLEWRDLGRFRGSCSLECHGEDHRDESYGPGGD